MIDHRAEGVEWRRRATEVLAPVTDLVAVPEGRRPAYPDLVVLDGRSVERAARCLGELPVDEPYEESTANARRRIGLAVLARMRSDGSDPMTAFEAMVDEPYSVLSNALADWVLGHGQGGRAALAASACSYAIGVAAWPPLRGLDPQAVEVSPVGANLDWPVPARAVLVRGRCDVLAPRGARPPHRRLLVVTGGSLDDAVDTASHAALTYTLSRSSVPSHVTVLALPTGAERFTVDEALLDRALDRLNAAAAAAMAARFGPLAATTAGAWCRRCGRADDCEDGRTWVSTEVVRYGGLRPLAG